VTNFLHKASGTSPSGQFWSFGLVSSGSISEAAAQASWNTRVSAFFADTNVKALYKTTTVLTHTSTSTASATFRQTTLSENTVSVAGTATTQESPEQCSMTFTTISALRTRSGHGRLFLPAPVSAALTVNTGGQIAGANMTNIAAAATTWFTGLVSDGLQPQILHRKATLGGLAAFSLTPVTSGKISNTLHTQKRRGDKRTTTYTAFTL
jgi:hypothetical protein